VDCGELSLRSGRRLAPPVQGHDTHTGRARNFALQFLLYRLAIGADPEITELDGGIASNQRLLERLEAENAQLRGSVVELVLQIQVLRDDALSAWSAIQSICD